MDISLAVVLLLAAVIVFGIAAWLGKNLVALGLTLWSAAELVGHIHIG